MHDIYTPRCTYATSSMSISKVWAGPLVCSRWFMYPKPPTLLLSYVKNCRHCIKPLGVKMMPRYQNVLVLHANDGKYKNKCADAV